MWLAGIVLLLGAIAGSAFEADGSFRLNPEPKVGQRPNKEPKIRQLLNPEPKTIVPLVERQYEELERIAEHQHEELERIGHLVERHQCDAMVDYRPVPAFLYSYKHTRDVCRKTVRMNPVFEFRILLEFMDIPEMCRVYNASRSAVKDQIFETVINKNMLATLAMMYCLDYITHVPTYESKDPVWRQLKRAILADDPPMARDALSKNRTLVDQCLWGSIASPILYASAGFGSMDMIQMLTIEFGADLNKPLGTCLGGSSAPP